MDARESREDFCESLFRARAKLSPNLHLDDDRGGGCSDQRLRLRRSRRYLLRRLERRVSDRSLVSLYEGIPYIVHEENSDWVVALARINARPEAIKSSRSCDNNSVARTSAYLRAGVVRDRSS